MTPLNRLFDIPKIQLEKYNLSVALVTKYNGKWKAISTKEIISNINNLSKTLLDYGIKPNDKIAIITNRSRNEWNITDYAIQQIGAVSVPIYDSTSPHDINYIFNHAEVKLCFVANESLYKKIAAIQDGIPSLKKIISFDPIKNVDNFEDAVALGNNLKNDQDLEVIKNAIERKDLVTIIYTSGTTGTPKGVMLSHHNIISNLEGLQSSVPDLPNNPKALSFLPVSHIFERLMQYQYQINGLAVYFAESIESLSSDISIVKPHVMSVVPRVIEKIHDKIIEKGNELKGFKKKLFNWALDIGYQYEADGKNGKKYERNLNRARKIIFNKWKDALGGNIVALFGGSSKLDIKLAKIFNAAGFNLMDGYGLTETSPVVSVSSPLPGKNKIGAVGRPLENIELKIDKNNEILVKGPIVMMGYYKDKERTKKTIINGYLRTGDTGKLDKDGFLHITGRIKETFKTSGGKYINPTRIENELKKSPLIEQINVIGEYEKFPAAIIQPNFGNLAKIVNIPLKSGQKNYTNIINTTKAYDAIQKELDKFNQSLGQWEKIKKFELTPDEWTTESGHLTPTLKVKRDVIKSKYYTLYNKIYRPTN